MIRRYVKLIMCPFVLTFFMKTAYNKAFFLVFSKKLNFMFNFFFFFLIKSFKIIFFPLKKVFATYEVHRIIISFP